VLGRAVPVTFATLQEPAATATTTASRSITDHRAKGSLIIPPPTMIGILTKALKNVFGDKATRDLKEVMPLVEQLQGEFAKLDGLSHNDAPRSHPATEGPHCGGQDGEDNAKVEALRARSMRTRKWTSTSVSNAMRTSTRWRRKGLGQDRGGAAGDPSRGVRRGEGDGTSIQGEHRDPGVTATQLDRDLALRVPIP
jgi:hypothetical protein